MSSLSKVAKAQAVYNNSHLTAGLAPPWLCWSLTKLSPEPFFACHPMTMRYRLSFSDYFVIF
jgi:hypothetical protein